MFISCVRRRFPAIHNQFGNQVPRTKRGQGKAVSLHSRLGMGTGSSLGGERDFPYPLRCRSSGGVFEMVGSFSSAIQCGRLVHKNAAGGRGGAAPIF